MMACDRRIEIRLPGSEKDRAKRGAHERNLTMSEFMRRAVRSYLKISEPIRPDETPAVVALRRRINAIEARHGADIKEDLMRARKDAQALLGRFHQW